MVKHDICTQLLYWKYKKNVCFINRNVIYEAAVLYRKIIYLKILKKNFLSLSRIIFKKAVYNVLC